MFPSEDDRPPEPPAPRTVSLQIIMPAFSIAAGTLLLIARLEGSSNAEAHLVREPLQLLQQVGMHGVVAISFIVWGLSVLLGSEHRLAAVRLCVLVVGLVSFTAFTQLGWMEGWTNKTVLLLFCIVMIIISTVTARLMDDGALSQPLSSEPGGDARADVNVVHGPLGSQDSASIDVGVSSASGSAVQRRRGHGSSVDEGG